MGYLQNIVKNIHVLGEPFEKEFRPLLGNNDEFFGAPGDRHYRLLSYIASNLTNKKILVTDGYKGFSSLALSYDLSLQNTVHAFSRFDFFEQNIKERSNILYYEGDIMERRMQETWKSLILDCDIIFMDCSPHTGTNEYAFYEFLQQNLYSGILICDHIWSMKQMRDQFWYKIPDDYRYDLTLVGNHSGTGIVCFNSKNESNIVESRFPWLHALKSEVHETTKDWTLVTAYFNLTKCPDASAEIKARDSKYYFEHSVSTLSLPYNLVIYCDEDSHPIIQQMRPECYAARTKYVIVDFEKIQLLTNGKTFSEYREQILENRRKYPYHFDPRNTGSYYLFCLSRYWMLQEVILENPFESSHFSWINFCIERMGYKNLVHLEECLMQKRDKFSTCYIDYIPRQLVERTSEYFQAGRCSMCSGFFTGNRFYMFNACRLIVEKFQKYVDEGYGHADEQLYSPVFFENLELFDQYYGDYSEMITNYTYIYERPTEPVHNFIRNSFQHGNYELCMRACKALLESIANKKCKLDDNYMRILERYFTQCYLKEIQNN